jgi:hypothetical protein
MWAILDYLPESCAQKRNDSAFPPYIMKATETFSSLAIFALQSSQAGAHILQCTTGRWPREDRPLALP